MEYEAPKPKVKSLVERVSDLEKQIAQQDYLVVEVANMTNLSEDERSILAEKYKNGILADVLLRDLYGTVSKIVAWAKDEDGNLAGLTYVYDGELVAIEY